MGGLFDDGAKARAAVDAYIKRSEERLAYRQKAGRGLSKAHRKQLGELLKSLDALRERLDTLLRGPGPDAERLLADFRRLESEVDALGVHDEEQ